MPTFSVLTPAFNEAFYIEEMMTSMQAQDYDDWEIIVVNDGSTDNTVEIVQGRSELDPRIKLIDPGRKIGKVEAMNTAFAASSGAIIFHLAGDDVLVQSGLRKRLRCFSLREDGNPRPCQSAFFKMKTLSESPKFDNMTLPKGLHSSKTSSSPTFTRDIANSIFPIPDALISEDLWIAFLADELAHTTTSSMEIAWRYRIHAQNSNPRHKSFKHMSDEISKRMAVWSLLLQTNRFDFSNDTKNRLTMNTQLEDMRRKGDILGILFKSNSRLIDRLATASMAHPLLYRVRMTFYRTFTGIRGA